MLLLLLEARARRARQCSSGDRVRVVVLALVGCAAFALRAARAATGSASARGARASACAARSSSAARTALLRRRDGAPLLPCGAGRSSASRCSASAALAASARSLPGARARLDGLRGFLALARSPLPAAARGLLFEHVALEVGLLVAHLDVDRARGPAAEATLISLCDLRCSVILRGAGVGLLRRPWARRRCVSSSILASSLMTSSGPAT